MLGVAFGHILCVDDPHVAADAAILVEDRPLDHAVVADRQVRAAAALVLRPLLVGLVAIGPDQDGLAQGDIPADPAAHADDRALDRRSRLDDAAVADDGMIEIRIHDARRRQVAQAACR